MILGVRAGACGVEEATEAAGEPPPGEAAVAVSTTGVAEGDANCGLRGILAVFAVS